MTPNLLEKKKFRVITRKKKHHRQLFYQAIVNFVNFIRNRFRQKEYIEKNFWEEDFSRELQLMFSFFSSGLDKLETQLRTFIHIVDEKQVWIKDAIKIISSLNASQNLLVSEVLKLVKLTLTVPAASTVSERSCSTVCRVKSYLRSSMIQDSKFLFSSCYL